MTLHKSTCQNVSKYIATDTKVSGYICQYLIRSNSLAKPFKIYFILQTNHKGTAILTYLYQSSRLTLSIAGKDACLGMKGVCL